ncbi:T9SS type A sorting domain-containing protein [Saccharicrinis aurantiacus]|uniref:T9SS type A sorting domain-containing protein n=1 Tax=Saccharicrinis aurantiacus TaxID=1849719 RepID=UPI00094F67B3|nr:T9SS type A sorting domain-containing protein [Saccharicrinis aurantiacus]
MKKTKFSNKVVFICFITMILINVSINATNYYVATWGNDSNNGSEGKPWKTIQKAANTAKAGDQIYIKKGSYYNNVVIKNSGTSSNWIIFKAYPGHEKQVVLNNAYFIISKKSYIAISGIKVQNGKHGFYIEGPSEHIEITNNHTYNTFASGIIVWGVAYGQNPGNYNNIRNVKIKNNKVQKACNGGWNECITIANGVVGFEVTGNEIYDGGNPINGGEGIDIKEGAKNGIIAYNNIHNLSRRGIYLDAGGLLNFAKPTISNIKVYNNISRNNVGAGMAIMTEGNGDVYGISIYNNLFYSNTEDGIMYYKHPAGSGKIYNISCNNNTMYKNGRYGILVNFSGAWGLQFNNNICYESSNSDYKNIAGSVSTTKNLFNTNPQFKNANGGNFRLNWNSPAINAGTWSGAPTVDYDGNARVGNVDIGAFEYTAGLKSISATEQEFSTTCDDYKVFPNPATNVITVSIPKCDNEFTLNFYDGMGKLKKSVQSNSVSTNVDISDLEKGIYFIELGDKKTLRFIKK